MGDDFVHNYIEEITNDIIKSMEYELINRGLTEEQQKKVIKEIMLWLVLFAWGKGEYKEPKEITECETNAKAREKIARFIFQIRQFKEFDLTRMQAYLQQFYVIETNPKISEVIGDMHTLIRYLKEFLYGTK